MATRNILKDGEKGLLKKSRTVTDFNKRLHILLDDMRETLIEANGVGLAAPQVGVLRRVALIVDMCIESEQLNDDCEEDVEDENQNRNTIDINELIIELINPEIVTEEGEQTGNEGCLSIPGVYGIVTRPETVVVRAQDRNGKTFEIEVSEMTARAACHEVDHLNGVLFTTLAERILTEEELAELAQQKEE
ncbi:MAG: peptide deformylase [Oscillospiraceae bacterium]|nr:peptide deformylase [Oscillospiraceae bacterium]